MLPPRGQHASYVQIADVDLLRRLLARRLVSAARQHLQLGIRIRREEKGQRVALQRRLVAHPMHGGGELARRVPLEVLPDVAHEGAFLRGRVDPEAVLVEDLEGGDVVLEDEGEPCAGVSRGWVGGRAK
jgi:hypothetical protein